MEPVGPLQFSLVPISVPTLQSVPWQPVPLKFSLVPSSTLRMNFQKDSFLTFSLLEIRNNFLSIQQVLHALSNQCH
jgi:hypothetical protein